jgi:hypothetical protein
MEEFFVGLFVVICWVLLVAVVLALGALFWGWIAMLVIGVIHSFSPGVATIAYGWKAWGIGLLFTIISGAFTAEVRVVEK